MPNPSFGVSNGGPATDNPTPMRSVYPDAPGATIGAATGGASLVTTGATSGAAGDFVGADSSAPSSAGFLGQPLTVWAALIVVWLVLGVVARKAGSEGEFSNVRVSAYNVLMITLAAIVGIVALKALLTRFRVPGLSPLIQAV